MLETLIIGAGVIGSSVAMHLARKGMTGIRVLDSDLEGPLSSSELNAGGVRATWGQPLNIEMSKLSIDYFATVAEEVGYRPVGYLWLHGPEKMPAALKARELQQKLGWPVEAWDVAELRRRVPFIDKTDDLAGAVFGSRDGLVNPNRLKNHFRDQARKLGVEFLDRRLARAAEFGPDGSVTLKVERLPARGGLDVEAELLLQPAGQGPAAQPPATQLEEYRARRVINCAGPWAAQVAALLGYASPSKAYRRQVSVFDCRDVDLTPYGMIIDSTGVYFHPEASNGLSGFACPGELAGQNFEYDGESFFMERIWPALYERATAFERLRHLTGWAGLYEVSPDDSGIIGKAPGSRQVYEAHSFSGHGVMHSHAAGLALAELVMGGRFETLDASPLSGKRFSEGRSLREALVI